mmetsp:Transcript_129382/g.351059  ORF Transcript_129382/g.351059 Transcript_129382/m.351059 type:complete len:254 (-) Transcript_129382:28-789(-)
MTTGSTGGALRELLAEKSRLPAAPVASISAACAHWVALGTLLARTSTSAWCASPDFSCDIRTSRVPGARALDPSLTSMSGTSIALTVIHCCGDHQGPSTVRKTSAIVSLRTINLPGDEFGVGMTTSAILSPVQSKNSRLLLRNACRTLASMVPSDATKRTALDRLRDSPIKLATASPLSVRTTLYSSVALGNTSSTVNFVGGSKPAAHFAVVLQPAGQRMSGRGSSTGGNPRPRRTPRSPAIAGSDTAACGWL